IVYEAGEILRFDKNATNIGLQGIYNVMHHIKMLESPITNSGDYKNTFIAQSSTWIRAIQSGIFVPEVELGDRVKKNQIIATISNPFGDNKIAINSHEDGVIIGLTKIPLVNKGDALMHLGLDKNSDSKDINYFAMSGHENLSSNLD
ncbi:MAG: succinylglutamate desuccinylase/aspartoacylase family protein, partial [Alphaproteobacteria bacterium]